MKSAIVSGPGAPATGVAAPANVRTGPSAEAIAQALIDNLHCLQAKLPQHATRNDWYMALAYTVRDRMLERYVATLGAMTSADTPVRAVAYLSAEFLTGPHLGNSLISLGIWEAVERALVWAAWLRVTWTRWRRSTCPPSAMAFATNSASSTK